MESLVESTKRQVNQVALAAVLKALEDLGDYDIERVLKTAAVFYRVKWGDA
jgi:hypothetical protein